MVRERIKEVCPEYNRGKGCGGDVKITVFVQDGKVEKEIVSGCGKYEMSARLFVESVVDKCSSEYEGCAAAVVAEKTRTALSCNWATLCLNWKSFTRDIPNEKAPDRWVDEYEIKYTDNTCK